MSEFSKIAIAFVLGIIAEPIRATLMASFNAKPLRRALYMELAALHRVLQKLEKKQSKRDTTSFEEEIAVAYARLDAHQLRRVSFDIYRNAKATKPEFYSLPDAATFNELFGSYEDYVKTPPPGLEGDEDVVEHARAMLHFIDRYLKDGRLNDDIFRDVYPEYTDYLANKDKEKVAAAIPTK